MTDYFALACAIVREQFPNLVKANRPSMVVTDSGNRGNDSPAPNPLHHALASLQRYTDPEVIEERIQRQVREFEPYSIYPRDEGDQEQDFFEMSDNAKFADDEDRRQREAEDGQE